ncbi:EamA family transporter [Clostridium boliviensis]|uniref:EamA family transporter n=1 Tax=Clostridium boliviensis TaxID=318465 RepID=A0ABU4GSL7_9CLOT|nr:EamA family transporter [Clostridium boliviensis]MDW2800621.1 EamA family transporter [Clostridium boliviensis]
MKQMKDTLLTMLTPILWGSTYIIASVLIPIQRPVFVAFMRAFPIGLLLLLWYRKLPTGIWILKSFILGSLNIGIFFLFLFIAAYRLPGGIASIVGSVQPIFVILFSWLLLKEKPALRSYAAIAMMITGVELLLVKPQMTIDLWGVAAALCGAVVMALGVVLTKYWGKPEGVSQMEFTSWQLFFGSLILIPAVYLLEGSIPVLTPMNLAGLALLGVVNTGLAYYLWFRGIEILSPVRVSLLSPVNPLTAFILGYIVLGQRISFIQIVGVCVIIASIFVSQRK